MKYKMVIVSRICGLFFSLSRKNLINANKRKNNIAVLAAERLSAVITTMSHDAIIAAAS